MDAYLIENKFDTIEILFNNAFVRDGIAICGTRGWNYESTSNEDVRILTREIGRLNMSIEEAKKSGCEPVVFLHYPPVYDTIVCIAWSVSTMFRHLRVQLMS